MLFAEAMLFCCQGGVWFYAFERLYFMADVCWATGTPVPLLH